MKIFSNKYHCCVFLEFNMGIIQSPWQQGGKVMISPWNLSAHYGISLLGDDI